MAHLICLFIEVLLFYGWYSENKNNNLLTFNPFIPQIKCRLIQINIFTQITTKSQIVLLSFNQISRVPITFFSLKFQNLACGLDFHYFLFKKKWQISWENVDEKKKIRKSNFLLQKQKNYYPSRKHVNVFPFFGYSFIIFVAFFKLFYTNKKACLI